MPKLKTRRSVKKRIRISKGGKVKYFKAGRSHLLTGKRSKRKRLMGKDGYLSGGDKDVVKIMLPYGA